MKSLIVANWKMNPPTFKEAKALFNETRRMAGLLKGLTIIVAPPSLYLRDLSGGKKGRVAFAAQNVHFEEKGSHTGEIAALQARDSKAGYVIVGHAERRAVGESNDDVQKKVTAVLAAHLTPILCVGERERGGNAEHFAFVREQLRSALLNVAESKISKIIIAYEPLWAIGASEAMRPHDMHEMSIFIRKTLVEKFGEVGYSVKVLYGGSVDALNAPALLQNGDIKGLLVGRVSVEREAFAELLRAVAKA